MALRDLFDPDKRSKEELRQALESSQNHSGILAAEVRSLENTLTAQTAELARLVAEAQCLRGEVTTEQGRVAELGAELSSERNAHAGTRTERDEAIRLRELEAETYRNAWDRLKSREAHVEELERGALAKDQQLTANAAKQEVQQAALDQWHAKLEEVSGHQEQQSARLDQREASAQMREERLTSREADMRLREAAVGERERSARQREQQLDPKTEELKRRERQLDQKQMSLTQQESALRQREARVERAASLDKREQDVLV